MREPVHTAEAIVTEAPECSPRVAWQEEKRSCTAYRAMRTSAPRNLYCHGDVHVDVIYLAPWLIEQAGPGLLGYLQGRLEQEA